MQPGYVRIIAGKWRSRQLPIVNDEKLRPTPDRVRETLFNWLNDYLPGAKCLDAFAGSGCLGFEALSRGAHHVVFTENSSEIVAALKKNVALLCAENAYIYGLNFLAAPLPASPSFDVVFLDPPYAANLLLPACFYLERHNLLTQNALIYLETNCMINHNELPQNWSIIKAKKAGMVFYYLAQRFKDHC